MPAGMRLRVRQQGLPSAINAGAQPLQRHRRRPYPSTTVFAKVTGHQAVSLSPPFWRFTRLALMLCNNVTPGHSRRCLGHTKVLSYNTGVMLFAGNTAGHE